MLWGGGVVPIWWGMFSQWLSLPLLVFHLLSRCDFIALGKTFYEMLSFLRAVEMIILYIMIILTQTRKCVT